MTNAQLHRSDVSGLPETLGLENCHGSTVLGLNEPPGVSRIAGSHMDVGHATCETDLDFKIIHGILLAKAGNVGKTKTVTFVTVSTEVK